MNSSGFINLGLRPCLGFPGGLAGKDSTCNAGVPALIPGLGSSPREGIGYPLQYPWAFQVAQMVKNLPAMWDTWVRSLVRQGTRFHMPQTNSLHAATKNNNNKKQV